MRIGYPIGQLRQYYQANPLSDAKSFSTAAIGPHASTSRAAYTVPAGRRAIIMGIQTLLQRVTAAAPVGLVTCGFTCTLNGHNAGIGGTLTMDNTANFLKYENEPLSIWLAAGDTVDIFTSDAGTGGTVQYSGSYTYMEFDA